MLHLRPLGQLSVYVIPHFFPKFLERTDGKNNKIFNFRTGENPVFMGFLSGENSQLFKKFRVIVAIVCGSFFIFNGLLNVLSAFDSRVCGLRLIIGDCPSVADFHRTRYAFLVA